MEVESDVGQPTLLLDRKSDSEDEEMPKRSETDLDHSTLGDSSLVPSTAGDNIEDDISGETEGHIPAGIMEESKTSRPTRMGFDGLVDIGRRLRKLGMEEKEIALLNQVWKESTKSNYRSAWKKWKEWSEKTEVNCLNRDQSILPSF